MKVNIILSIVCLIVFINLNIIIADEETHVYQEKENVYLWLNKVGPYHNPQETYTKNFDWDNKIKQEFLERYADDTNTAETAS